MKSYKITIEVSEVGGIYSAENMKEAEKIAQEECNNIYERLKGKCCVEVTSIKEIK